MMERPVFLTLLCYTMFLSLALLAQNCIRMSSAQTMPVIFPNSPESPLYKKNLTRTQTITWLLHHSTKRAHRLFSITATPDWVSSQGEIRVEEGPLLLLKLGIGTFDRPISYELYYLIIDSATSVTWVQCEDCKKVPNRCFGKPPNVYKNSKSSSYHPIPYGTHNLCFEGQSVRGFCSYTMEYGDGAVAKGILAIEKFTFPSLNDITTDVEFNLVFGCNFFHIGPSSGTDAIGMLGLAWGPRSFITQIKPQDDTFSYCFPHYDKTALGSRGYIKLGSDGGSYDGFSFTALRRYQDRNPYYLNLEGISVDQQRLNINPRIFIRDNGEGGTVIDSGSTFSHLVPPAYKELKKVLQTYFKSRGYNYKITKPGKGQYKFDLCYTSLRPEVSDLPSITLHFNGGADLVLNPDNVFIWMDDPPSSFCLAIKANNLDGSILGGYQQSNYRFIYDRRRMLLFFKQEYCHQGA